MTWACERDVARAVEGHAQVVDLKLLAQMESRPQAFARCPMVRRELYGLPGGDGVHWGPAIQDAWAQLLLHSLCPASNTVEMRKTKKPGGKNKTSDARARE